MSPSRPGALAASGCAEMGSLGRSSRNLAGHDLVKSPAALGSFGQLAGEAATRPSGYLLKFHQRGADEAGDVHPLSSSWLDPFDCFDLSVWVRSAIDSAAIRGDEPTLQLQSTCCDVVVT
jgi:hypothetical protein